MASVLEKRERVVVTRWFHQSHFGSEQGSPNETLFDVATEFLEALKRRQLGLDVPESSFRRSLCEALCVMRMYGVDGWTTPLRHTVYPHEWTQELNAMWTTWLTGRFLTPLFWQNFWGRIPVRRWEAKLDGWRQQMELILPMYIQPTMSLFVAQGLFVDDEDGGFMEVENSDY